MQGKLLIILALLPTLVLDDLPGDLVQKDARDSAVHAGGNEGDECCWRHVFGRPFVESLGTSVRVVCAVEPHYM